MKYSKYLFVFLICYFVAEPTLSAQPFFGYQTTGRHTWFFSLVWDGDQPALGIGYNYRIFNQAFTDIGAEWRIPIAHIMSFDDHEVIAGAYGPVKLDRLYSMLALHARFQHQKQDGNKKTRFGAAFTYLPGWVYRAPLDDSPYGAIALRGTYVATIAERNKAEAGKSWRWFTQHGVEAGGHFDIHLQRTLGMALNGFASKQWSLKRGQPLSDEEGEWKFRGDFYFGTTYYLERN